MLTFHQTTHYISHHASHTLEHHLLDPIRTLHALCTIHAFVPPSAYASVTWMNQHPQPCPAVLHCKLAHCAELLHPDQTDPYCTHACLLPIHALLHSPDHEMQRSERVGATLLCLLLFLLLPSGGMDIAAKGTLAAPAAAPNAAAVAVVVTWS